MISITQVLLLTDVGVSRELGLVLWAVLIEIEQFYNHGQDRAEFQRFYVSPYVPRSTPIGAAFRGINRALRGKEIEDALELLDPEERVERPISGVDRLKGRFIKTYDSEKIIAAVREIIGKSLGNRKLLIVTDRELTPPPGWRYVVSDGDVDNVVLSIASTDPKYWRDSDPNRLSTIKQRVRSAGLLITGRMLGLEFCSNVDCFLYGDWDSVTALDYMNILGEEHEIQELARYGYPTVVQDPTAIEGLVKDNNRN